MAYKEITEAEYAAAMERGIRAEKLAEGAPRLKLLRLLPGHPDNDPAFLGRFSDGMLSLEARYVVLGEVAKTRHFIVLNIGLGAAVPGMVHLDRFEEVPEDEI